MRRLPSAASLNAAVRLPLSTSCGALRCGMSRYHVAFGEWLNGTHALALRDLGAIAYIQVEPLNGTCPRLFCRNLIVALRCRVIEKAMHGVWIYVGFIADAILLERRFLSGPPIHCRFVEGAMMNKYSGLD